MNIEYPEGATPVDRSESEGLKLPHVLTRDRLNQVESDNIIQAEAKYFSKKQRNILSEPFLLRLHLDMFGTVWKWAGKYRTSEKNIGVAPWEVAVKLRELCENVQVWIETKSYPEDEIAARFHHKLVSIHPFANGNGRHARMAADLLLTNELGRTRFSWGQNDLLNQGEQRSRYIQALRTADDRNYSQLLQWIRSEQS